ncbi:tRNA (N6-threonylcarbamoyladenosine(37)-N6)-methyltransferase TrmO [Desulfuromonas versatilis]|uniref:tRNA (N6-threonylcarbamoyladenosine(37)-N6)-methyltransferase TrmO n=1 Tax=Desulfuromonas versatilis TaxID=2802975 RepID=A0ABM8HMD8_9BACT|nr:SAM-dependent methyltransferase [Desulfuromonas versatilis]BCR03437.1 tRNA (N6-threonylcarbamoyladenosine(37)-N6)-methyltransferase TrmO [Desulfuromonas versatilis]
MEAQLSYIGRIQTPYRSLDDCPRNIEPGGPLCRLAIDPPFAAGLEGLAPGQQILILYWFEAVNRGNLRQASRRTGEPAGVFALRTPHRPNPIGAAVLRIEELDGSGILVRGLDCLDGTPLLDIKPAMAAETGRSTWQ